MLPNDIFNWFQCLFPMWEGKIISYMPKDKDTIKMCTIDGSRVFYFTYKGGVSFTLKSMSLREAKEYEKNSTNKC